MNLDRLTRPSPVRAVQLGELCVTYVPDGSVQLIPQRWLSGSTEDDWAAHSELLDADGYLVASIGGLLVEHGDRALLIDAGYGPRQLPAHLTHPHLGALGGGSLPARLAELGRPAERIEAVAFTHLHEDHIGWATHSGFVNAGYLVAEPEWAFWRSRLSPSAVGTLAPRVELIGDGKQIFPGVIALASPGHTPGHTSYLISSGQTRLIAFGDAMHSPVQVTHPGWNASADIDPELGMRSRARLLDELTKPNTSGFGVHFADVVFGHISVDEGRRFWEPEPCS